MTVDISELLKARRLITEKILRTNDTYYGFDNLMRIYKAEIDSIEKLIDHIFESDNKRVIK